MIVVAILLLAVVVVVSFYALVAGSDPSTYLSAFGVTMHRLPGAVVFLAGAATLLLAEIAFGLLSRGTRRNLGRRRELRRLRKVEQKLTDAPTDGGTTQAQPAHDHPDFGKPSGGPEHGAP